MFELGPWDLGYLMIRVGDRCILHAAQEALVASVARGESNVSPAALDRLRCMLDAVGDLSDISIDQRPIAAGWRGVLLEGRG